MDGVFDVSAYVIYSCPGICVSFAPSFDYKEKEKKGGSRKTNHHP